MAGALRWGDETTEPAAFGTVGLLVVAAGLVWLAGPPGLVVAGVVAVAWWRLATPLVIAVGHVAALPVLPPSPDPTGLVLFEAGFLAVGAAPFLRGADRLVPLTVLELGAIGLGALAWAGWHAWQPRWLAGAALLSVVGLAAYGLHRYAVVALDRRGVAPEG